MEGIKKMCVYAASSDGASSRYREVAYELGRAIASRGITCVNGAGRAGLMRAVSDGALDSGGKVIGVIPQFMVEHGWQYERLSELRVTPDMRTRKQMMAEMADVAVALPGGCGTLEELLEIITWKQLGLYGGVVALLNVDGFYDNLLGMLERCMSDNLMKRLHAKLWHVARSVEELFAILEAIDPEKDSQIESKY